MLNHCMLDLETFGTKPGSVIRSIGAVMFDLDGRTGPEFYRNIDEESCVKAGLTYDPSTVSWWATAVGARVPWSYNDALDTRTAYVIGNLNAFSVKREGTYHNALDDAKHQVRCVAKAIAMSKGMAA